MLGFTLALCGSDGTWRKFVNSFSPAKKTSGEANRHSLARTCAHARLTNGKVTGNKVRAHGDLLSEFPYLGRPHNAGTTAEPRRGVFIEFVAGGIVSGELRIEHTPRVLGA